MILILPRNILLIILSCLKVCHHHVPIIITVSYMNYNEINGIKLLFPGLLLTPISHFIFYHKEKKNTNDDGTNVFFIS